MKKPIIACVLAAALVASSSANAALNAYLSLSANRVSIKGGVTQKGREGKIQVFAVDHTVTSVAGRKNYAPLVITKEVDKSSPLLYKALVNSEVISDFELQFFAPSPTGGEQMTYTIKLSNAKIVDIKFKKLNVRDPETMKYPELEEVSFSYTDMTWTWVNPNIVASDKF